MLIIDTIWILAAIILVYLSYLLRMGSAFGWIGLAMAFLPFPLRWLYQGGLRWRTPLDIPVALFVAGAVVGLIVSPDLSLSLGAFQCILVNLLFYYAWVNHPQLATMTRWLMIAGLLCVLVVVLLFRFGTPYISSQPGFAIGGTGTHHGVALCLVITAALFTGIAVFRKGAAVRLVAVAICLSFYIAVFFLTRESWKSLLTWHSISDRLPFWRETASLLSHSPFEGLGLGGWGWAYHGGPVLTHPTHVHNAYLQLYADTGILGILALLSLLIIGGKLAVDIIRSPRSHPWYGFGIGVVLACFLTLLVGVVESAPVGVPLVGQYTYYYIVSPAPWILGGFLVGAHRLICQTDVWHDNTR